MTPARARLTKATERLSRFTTELERIADWKADLAARLWRATIRAELVGLDLGERERLVDEVHAFRSVCESLADSLKGRAEHERRAA
jgi:hypothetical protein